MSSRAKRVESSKSPGRLLPQKHSELTLPEKLEVLAAAISEVESVMLARDCSLAASVTKFGDLKSELPALAAPLF